MNSLGTHILAEYSGCDPSVLSSCEDVELLLVKAADAAGAQIVARKTHRVKDGGVISVVVLQESHLSLHTHPADGYAAADFFTCGKCDSHNAHPILLDGLAAKSFQVIVLERGMEGTPKMRVLGHRATERVVVDCGAHVLPETVRVEKSPGRGLGLYATRAFQPGDMIYETAMWLASYDTEYVMKSEAGESVLTADDLGSELTISEVDAFPPHIRQTLADHYGLESPSSELLRDRLTDGSEREVLVTTFDGLMNHADDANTRVEREARSVRFQDDEPIWTIRIVAARSINVGDELFWNYSDAGFLPPASWVS